jgi:hypothetical protein
MGNFAAAEFRAARDVVGRDAQIVELPTSVAPTHVAPTLGGACPAAEPRDDESATDAELVIIAQELPGQWNGPWLAELRRHAPLVRSVAILGTWCEGESRTGRPLAADVRVYWHEFAPWWTGQMQILKSNKTPEWSRAEASLGGPLDSRTPHLAKASNRQSHVKDHNHATRERGLVVVAARDRDSFQAIALACDCGGWASVWLRPPMQSPIVHSASALIYDAGQLDEEELAAIRRLRELLGPLPVIALADFPTIDRACAAEESGASRVLGKPFEIEHLLWALKVSRAER